MNTDMTFAGTFSAGKRDTTTQRVNLTYDGQTGLLHIQWPRHSPSGLSWGYLGSGPAETARQILWLVLEAEPHSSCYQAFKEEVIGAFPQDSEWMLAGPDIEAWLTGWQARRRAAGQEAHATVVDYEAWLVSDVR